HSVIPCVGASGAIAGVMGAYVSIYPLNKVKIWFIVPMEAPALVVIGAWVIMQIVSAMHTGDSEMGAVAYCAHLRVISARFMLLRIMVFSLRREVEASERAKKASASASATAAPPEPFVPANPAGTAPGRADGHDPYAGFVTMQTIRRMQEK